MRFLAFILLLFAAATNLAQKSKPIPTQIKDFQANPNQDGRRIFIKGANADPAGNGVMDVTKPHVETFRADGAVDAIIDASQCFFDQAKTHDVWSAKDISMARADGRLAIKGEGFRWILAESQLSISNKVEATLRRQAFVPGSTSTNQDTIRITSDQMTYSGDMVIFRGHIHVVDRQGELRCQYLKVFYDQNAVQPLQQIEALDEVILTQGEIEARGKRALYSPSSGLLRLFENTKWKMADREGESELLIFDRTNNTFRAESKVRMRFPATLLSTNTPGATNMVASTNRVIVTADTFDFALTNTTTRGPIAIFNGNVHATDPQANLDCELLTIFFDTTNRLDRAIADRAVHIARPETEVHGEKAVFENGEITITGQPNWTHEKQTGASDILVFNPQTREIRATNVVMRFPYSSRTNLLTATTNISTGINTNILLVTAAYFTNKENTATFAQKVRASEPGGQMDANQLTVDFKTNRVERISAKGDVILTQEKSQAFGQEALYDSKTGTMRLLGLPKLITEDSEIIAREFVRTERNFKPLPPFQITIRHKGTNGFAPPF